MQQPGVIGTWLLQPYGSNKADTTDSMGEGKLRVGWDISKPWAVLVEVVSVEAARAVQQGVLAKAALKKQGVTGVVRVGVYRLNFCLGRFAFE